MELPPPPDALVDSFNAIFARSLHDLRKADWATVDRDEYVIRERQQQCPAFMRAVIRDDAAETRLPSHGVPDDVFCCAQEVAGSENIRLQGPATRALESCAAQPHGDDSETDADKSQPAEPNADVHLDGAEVSIAVEPIHELRPVKIMQALQC